MDALLFKKILSKNANRVKMMYDYLLYRKEDVAISLILPQPSRACKFGVILGAAISYALPNRVFDNSDKICLINETGKSVIELSSNDFEMYAAPYIIHSLELIRHDILSITTQSHAQTCLEQQLIVSVDIASWNFRWPNHCQSCKGAASFTTHATREEPETKDNCECVDPQDDVRPKCPRCGKQWPVQFHSENNETFMLCEVISKPIPCPYCKWNWGYGQDDILPEWIGCDCGLQQ